MFKREKIYLKTITAFLFSLFFFRNAFGQAELAPWGNLTGIRIDGQLMEFGSSLCVVKKDWTNVQSTGKERQRPKYERVGRQQVVTTKIDSISFTEKVEDGAIGEAKVNIAFSTNQDEALEGVYFCLSLPAGYNAKATMQAGKAKPMPLGGDTNNLNYYNGPPVRTIKFFSPSRQLELNFLEPVAIILKNEQDKAGAHINLYVPLHTGNLLSGESVQDSFTVKATGYFDRSAVAIALHAGKEGNIFDGFGGNFRLQNPKADPQVIDYCLKNMRVAWSRVEMPWRFWQPDKNADPVEAAKNGNLNPNVQHAMEMAQRLGKMGIPVILSAWSAPAWAIVGPPKFRPGPDGVWGNPLDANSMQETYKSIADYIEYLKDNYGVEASLFSFNESDLGINVRFTADEHAAFIKGMGAYFAARGLKTKLLLGDNSDATSISFIYPALSDPATYPYIGAVSFHSWRGWEKELLQQWADAAKKINRPLLVCEGSIDAQAWGYPAVFEEPTYALQEISLYTRLMAICQPLSILQWQLTADYSPLSGGGIFGDNTPLRPTQRFWNLKQLASTPKALKAIPLTVSGSDISAAALGDKAKGVYVLHLVNNGRTRKVNLSGLPAGLKTLQVYVTSQQSAMKKGDPVMVNEGKTSFTLAAGAFTTLRN